MKKILVIDDEEMIRTGLPNLIEWEDYGYQVAWTAENGEEGLKIILTEHPDLVITDIRMPKMNGLEMLKQAKAQQSDFYSIVLSGYSDFEYAKEAIKLGLASYLLKPVDEDELIEILVSINQSDQVQRENTLKQELMSKIFGNDHTGLQGFQQINCLCYPQEEVPEMLETIVQHAAVTVTLNNFGYNYLFLLDRVALEVAGKSLVDLLGQEEILMTGWLKTNQDLHVIADTVRELQRMTFLFSNQWISQAKLLKKQSQVLYTEHITNQFVETILNNQPLLPILTAYRNNFIFELAYERDIKWHVNHEFEQIILLVAQRIGANPETLTAENHSNKEFFWSAVTCADLLQRFQERLAEFSLSVAKQLNNLDIVLEIIHFMEKNYQKDLTLKSVSDQFGYNSAYLGKKFKKKTNETFLSYLEKIRMNRAADLLQNSNLMVYEVAENVGYHNVDYFYKKFKQFFKQSPNEFRKKITE